MIYQLKVIDTGGRVIVYEQFSRFHTDSSNNLCVLDSDSEGERLIGVFAAGQWRSAIVRDKEA